MSEELKVKLLEDILKTGFPLEMEISQKLRSNGWRVSNSSYYIDMDENKGREIDIISSIHKNKEVYKEIYLEILFSLIVEIKKTEDKPWIFFTSEVHGPIEKYLPKDYVMSGFANKPHVINRLLRKNTEKVNTRIGRNFYQGFTKNGGRDDIYKALSGVIKATYHFMENSSAKDNNSVDRLIHFFEPVVVIKGKLFETYLKEDGEQVLEEVNYIQTQFNYLSPNYSDGTSSNKVVHVITSDYLETFVIERKESLNAFFEDLVNNDIH
ncbi:hypothetical protein [Metabacillus elymi]|uniref:Uncharacterized protein n=1 Tax=Metabacillus elymi TaxID=2745198 RepID=A0ABX6S6C3_9BACI|nr:hypothetical protein [Metabacillus sp. KUDC1714]QNF29635.1 hypothetical protein HUW50_20360 [Metabacillus sp. KUDC1714]